VVPIVLLIYPVQEQRMNEAIAAIEALDSIRAPVMRIRLEYSGRGLTVATTLHLLMPGLLGPGRWIWRCPARRRPRWNGCWRELMLRRRLPVHGRRAVPTFRRADPTEADLPVAAVTALVDGGEPDGGWWLRADPVHLRPDLQRRVPGRTPGRWPLNRSRRRRWRRRSIRPSPLTGCNSTSPARSAGICACRTDPGLRTYPLLDAIGRDINPPCCPMGRTFGAGIPC
jgi:hypothetical protein